MKKIFQSATLFCLFAQQVLASDVEHCEQITNDYLALERAKQSGQNSDEQKSEAPSDHSTEEPAER